MYMRARARHERASCVGLLEHPLGEYAPHRRARGGPLATVTATANTFATGEPLVPVGISAPTGGLAASSEPPECVFKRMRVLIHPPLRQLGTRLSQNGVATALQQLHGRLGERARIARVSERNRAALLVLGVQRSIGRALGEHCSSSR